MTSSNGWRPELVALDIDGTVCVDDADDYLRSHHTVSPAVREAVRAVVQSGTILVLATGRTSRATMPFLDHFGLTGGTALCSNGAVWIDAVSGSVLHKSVFDLVEPLTILHEALPDAIFTVEEVGTTDRTNRLTTQDLSHGNARQVDLAELMATPTTRLAVHWPGRTSADLVAALSGVALAGLHCSFFLEGPGMVATLGGVNKGTSLARLCAQLGVSPDRTLAVGDGTNDIEMLTWAAHGVAMGQARDVVRAAADEVCAPVTEDGLARLLARWF